MEETGNVEAGQRQLGHRNAAYSLQYSRITEEELEEAIPSANSSDIFPYGWQSNEMRQCVGTFNRMHAMIGTS